MKKVIRLTENDIHRIVKNSVNNVLKEGVYTDEELGAQKIFDAAMKALQSLGKKANLIAYILAQMKSSVANWGGAIQKNSAHMIQDCKIFRTFAPWKAKHQK